MKVGGGFHWAVIFGNGYGTDRTDGRRGTGRAALYVVFLDKKSDLKNVNNTWRTIGGTGQVEYVKIPMVPDLLAGKCASVSPPANEECGGSGPDNGLGVPTPVDTNGDGIVDVIYAADLKGNIWKIKVTGDMSSWPDTGNISRLYSAKGGEDKPQPITTAVSAIAHPFGGYIINAVTGRSLQRADFPTLQTQTVYGIWDKPRQTLPVAGRTKLQKQTVATTKTADGRFRYGISADVDMETKLGWYLDLPEAGETGIFDPYVRAGSLIVETLLPKASKDTCTALTGIVINMFDPVTGRTPTATFDRDGSNLFNNNDKVLVNGVYTSMSGEFIQGMSRSVRLAQPPGADSSPGGPGKSMSCASKHVSVTAAGGTTTSTLNNCENTGRLYWREVTRNLPSGTK